IKYVLRAKLLGPRDSPEPTLMSVAQDIEFVPETVAPLLPVPATCPTARYAFCDSAIDADGQPWAFHVHATALQQAFSPGGAVDLQLRVTGRRTLRKLQFSLIEQTDCFYPHIPDPREEQLDIGRRLWSSQRVLCGPTALHFERDSCVPAVDLCPDHMGARQSRSGLSTYHASLHTRLPADALVLHESGFLRFTCFVQLSLSAGSSAWGTSSPRSAQVKLPIPAATRILTDNASALPSPLSCTADARTAPLLAQRRQSASAASVCGSGSGVPYMRRRGPSTSSSVRTDVDSLDQYGCDSDAECAPAEPPLKHGRSIADLGARLQQFIPRRLPSAINTRTEPLASRAVSHGWIPDHGSPQWSMLDLPPMPRSAGSAAGCAANANASQHSMFSSPLVRSASVETANNGDAAYAASAGHLPALAANVAPQQQQQQQSAPAGFATRPYHSSSVHADGGRFSLTFLLRQRELYHDEAAAAALSSLLSGHDSDGNSIIPSAICRVPPAGAGPVRPGQQPGRRGEYRSRDFSLGLGAAGLSKRSKRTSIQSLSSMVASSDRVRPRLEAVMASFRHPLTSQVETWSVLGTPGRPQSMHYHPALAHKELGSRAADPAAAAAAGMQSRFSRLSAMSVSSNDTACASNGCMSLPKDMLPPIPSLLSPLVDVSTAAMVFEHLP
ncbi:hypothetical protein IWQ56_004714, partial [Coemansia nantahalensis]